MNHDVPVDTRPSAVVNASYIINSSEIMVYKAQVQTDSALRTLSAANLKFRHHEKDPI
jgi:hypothetical protein